MLSTSSYNLSALLVSKLDDLIQIVWEEDDQEGRQL